MKIKIKKKSKQEKKPLPKPDKVLTDFSNMKLDHTDDGSNPQIEILRLRKKVKELEDNLAESPEKYVWTDKSYQRIVKQRDLYYDYLMEHAWEHLPTEIQNQLIPF